MKIKTNNDGIEFNYRRFLSDSAAGYIIILLIILNFYLPILTVKPVSNNMFSIMSNEIKVFLGALLFMLATPVGMFVNAIGWYVFGRLQHSIESRCFTHRNSWIGGWFIKPSADEFCLAKLEEAFGLTSENWVVTTRFFVGFFKCDYKEQLEEYQYIEGVRIFLRSLATISTAILLIHCFQIRELSCQTFVLVTVLFISILFLLALSGLVSYYYQLALMFLVYRQCRKNNQYAPLAPGYDEYNRLCQLMLKNMEKHANGL